MKAGRVDFKLDKNGNISVVIGKASFDAALLQDNANAVIEAIIGVRPATAKGRLLTSGAIAATMSPGVKLDVYPLEKL